MTEDKARRMAEEVLPVEKAALVADLMKMADEYAESRHVNGHKSYNETTDSYRSALREAIAAALVKLTQGQEPVARVAEVHMSRYTIEWENGSLPIGTNLYTHPSQQEERVRGLEKTLKLAQRALNSCTVGIYGDPLSFSLSKVESALDAIHAARNKEQGE